MKVLCILLYVAFASGFYIDNNGTNEEKIIGGNPASLVDIPYQASLYRLSYLCGASIIHESWVITAAHCVKNRTRISVKTGTRFRNVVGNRHRVKKIIIHEEFDIGSKSNNDIALIMLAKPIRFDYRQQSIDIAKPHDIPKEGDLMQISGFGETGPHLEESDVLLVAHVHVVNQERCQRIYRSDPITDNMFCAGSGNPNIADGDSGGPGVIHGKLYGISSTSANSESSIFPGVYTRVHKYYNWIVEKTGLRL